MFRRCNNACALLVLLTLFAISVPAWAVQMVYTDEAMYLADLGTMGFISAFDDFEEDNFWGLLETDTAPDVTSQGVTWTGLGGGVTLLNGVERSADWALESSPPGSPFDGFLATTSEPLVGFGGWLKSGNAGSGAQNDISVFLNGSPVSVDGFGSPTSAYVFWGIIDTAGISSVQFETEPVQLPEPGSGDPIDPSKTFFLDDFTFGFTAVPSLREPGTAWTNTAGGTYTTGTNWSGGAVPLTSDNALFHLGSVAPYTVNLSQNETTSQAVIANDKVNLDLGGFQFSLTESNITRESLIVGERPGDVGELTVSNGSLVGVNVVVAHSTASTGHLTVNAGSTINLSGTMRVGSGGTGTLDINAGSVITSGSSGVAYGGIVGQLNGTGTVNVTGTGTQWNIASFKPLAVGLGGTGTLNLSNGAAVSANSLIAGLKAGNGLTNEPTGMGTINVTGAGTSLSGSLVIAQDGPASLNVTNGAQLTGRSGSIAVSADANVLLDGSGTDWTMNISGSSRGTLNVGVGDQNGSFATIPPPPLHTGTLTIQNGATVTAEESFIGTTRTGSGILTVTGSGSSWSSGSQFSGNTFIGYEGDGELNVLAGATIQTGQTIIGRFGLRDQLKGVANIDGAGSRWDTPSTIFVGFNNDPQIFFGSAIFFAEGNFNVTNGGVVAAGRLALAERKISKGVVNISGPGSSITTPSASLGTVSTNGFTFTFGSNAELNVSNSGLLDVSGDVNVYHGTINLNQGTINATNLFMHGKLLTAGSSSSDPTGDTAVILAGTGLVNANVDNIGGIVTPGQSAGILNISGNYIQHTNTGGGFEHNASLAIELGGTDNSDPLNPQFDQLLISGLATLGGTLDVSLIDLGGGQFVPQLGNSFGILSATGGLVGTFDTLNLPVLSGGLQWQLNPSGNTLFLDVIGSLTADFDSDGDVDGNDLTDPTLGWEARYGVDLGGVDFLAWQQQFGSNVTPLAASNAVPEPSTTVLFIMAFFGFMLCRCRSTVPSEIILLLKS